MHKKLALDHVKHAGNSAGPHEHAGNQFPHARIVRAFPRTWTAPMHRTISCVLRATCLWATHLWTMGLCIMGDAPAGHKLWAWAQRAMYGHGLPPASRARGITQQGSALLPTPFFLFLSFLLPIPLLADFSFWLPKPSWSIANIVLTPWTRRFKTILQSLVYPNNHLKLWEDSWVFFSSFPFSIVHSTQ